MGKGISFEPGKDIPSLTGKVILVTGGNAGLGRESIIELIKHNPLEIWLTARDSEKGLATVTELQALMPHAPIKVLQLDLTSFQSIKQAAKVLLASTERLDILMLNAGIMATPPGMTKDGYEIQFGTNHVGHALFTKLVMPLLQKTADTSANADVRIISISSTGHNWAPPEGINFHNLKSDADDISTWARYGQSKLANILYAKELAKQYPNLKVVAVHPGSVRTDLLNRMTEGNCFLSAISTVAQAFTTVSIQEGVKNQLWATVCSDLVSGEYYEPIGVTGKGSKMTKDQALAAKLWQWTEEELKGQGLE